MMNIYQDLKLLPLDISGWNGNREVFGKLVSLVRPSLIIEVGTWKGQSTFNMAGHIKRLGLACQIYCVDTWLGSLEFWVGDGGPRKDFELDNGYPRTYRQFMSNVVHMGCQDVIVPFPMTSSTGHKYFSKNGILAELIYLDASHEEDDVYQDVVGYWNILKPGGIMFGDDWNSYGVRPAVERFARERGLGLDILENHFWSIRAS
jgi:hypothetical protein